MINKKLIILKAVYLNKKKQRSEQMNPNLNPNFQNMILQIKIILIKIKVKNVMLKF